jgi:copper chaperone NosL
MNTPRSKLSASLFYVLLTTGLLTACSDPQGAGDAAVKPVEITTATACALDGMLLADYPGPKAQIHFAGRPAPDFFCDTTEMFNIWHNPEQATRIAAIYVQDMGGTDWDKPQGHWINAKTAFYVTGSKRLGSMGPTIASFAREADARTFAQAHGGTVLRFEEVSANQSMLDGGALHDHSM